MPEELQVDIPAILGTLIVLAVLIGSAVIWYESSQKKESALYPKNPIPAWAIGWVNFGLFMCALVLAIVFFQSLGRQLLSERIQAMNGELTPEIAIVAVLLLQLPMLGVFYLARRFYPSAYAGRLNDRNLSLGQAARIAAPLFIKFLPVIWFVSLVWGFLMNWLQDIGLVDDLPKQELVELFSAGGDILPISILVLCAVILAPVVEETIFRGCIYRFLKSQTMVPVAQILSGLFFGLMHANLASLVPLVVVGILLARIYERSGNLLVPICFHTFFNGFNLILLFIMSQSNMAM